MEGLDDLLLVSALPGYLRAARLAEDRLEDLVVLRDDRPQLQGNLYLGRVTGLDRGLEAAFVDIGLGAPGFLPFDRAGRRPVEGESLVVAVQREASEAKGVRLTTRIPAAERGAAEAEAPALLHRAADPLQRLLAGPPPARVLVDGPEALAALEGCAGLPAPERHQGRTTLFEAQGLAEEVEALLDPRVPLPGGGSLLIEPTRALVAVDVNAGAGRAGDAAKLALEVDLEAAEALARQLRLRNLAGLVVVDFLELKPRERRQEVVRRLRRHLKRDPQAGQVRPMSDSGLVELTRRRSGPALFELLTRPCGLHGSGRAWDPAVLAWELLLRLRHGARGRAAAPRILCSPAVAAAFAGPAEAARRSVEADLGQALILQAEPDRADDSAEVVL